jgi:hypothetical protein
MTPIASPQLIYERANEPSEQSPILYRERGYVIDALQSDDELEEYLEAELSEIRLSWQDRDASQFVQLAVFDHEFELDPSSPPVATLSWKDWQGKSEIWVRGVRRSTAPPPEDQADPDDFEELEELTRSAVSRLVSDAPEGEEREAEPIPLVSRRSSAPEPESRGADSGPGWQSPHRSGEFEIPSTEELEAAVPPPSSQRVLASEELLGASFERMHELRYLPNVVAGAAYVLETLEELIPSDGALIHVFDIDTRQFIVVRALGPRSRELLLTRTPGVGSYLEEALRRQTTSRSSSEDGLDGRAAWEALGLHIRWALCSPVHQHGRYLGAIELGRQSTSGDFNAGQIHALEYICEQFADFVADRPLDLTSESVLPPED